MRVAGNIAAGLLLTAAAFGAPAGRAGLPTLHLSADGHQTLTFDRPVQTFYIEDPAVLDASAVDKTHIALIGRGRGATAVQAVDAGGARIAAYRVVVGERAAVRRSSGGAAGGAGTVILLRGAERIVYYCSRSHCARTAALTAPVASAEPGAPPAPPAGPAPVAP